MWPGHRESTESWLKVLRDLRDRGLRAPLLLMADGGLPIWSAAEQVWPEASHQPLLESQDPQRARRPAQAGSGKSAGVVDADPFGGDAARGRETTRHVCPPLPRDRYPQAVATPRTRLGAHGHLLTSFPGSTGKHLRTTNPVESPFASVRLRTPTPASATSGSRERPALIWRVLMVAEKTLSKTQCAPNYCPSSTPDNNTGMGNL